MRTTDVMMAPLEELRRPSRVALQRRGIEDADAIPEGWRDLAYSTATAS